MDAADGDEEGDDVLFRELQSTAVYDSLQRQPPERYIMSLTEAEALYELIRSASAASDASAIAQCAPEIVVQVRKRNGAVQILLDGFVSEGEPPDSKSPDNVRVHKLNFHKGLHEDWETNTRILSPLAIVAAVEDGQLPLQHVGVSVWQNFYHEGQPVAEAQMLAEVSLVPHRVADVRCAVARAPYPLRFAKPPTVTIPDTIDKDFFMDWTNKKSFLDILPEAAKKTFDYLRKNKGATPGVLAWEFSETAIIMGTAALLQAFERPYAAFLVKAFGKADPNAAGATTGSVAASAVERILFKGTQDYVTARPPPMEKDVTFTLEEFAKALETLAVVKPMDATDGDPFAQGVKHGFKHERVIWHWLSMGGRGASITAGLKLDASDSTGTHVRISIDDPMGCEPTTRYHDIHCGRADVHVLGAVASGVLNDLYRVRDAIRKLSLMLDRAVEEPNRGQTWPDKHILMPAYLLVTAAYERAATKGTAMGALNNVQAYTAKVWTHQQGPNGTSRDARHEWFQTAQTKMFAALVVPFEQSDDVKKLEATLRQSMNALKAPLPGPTTAWVRRLPQRVRSVVATRLFARAVDYSTEYADVYTDAATIREFTPHSKLTQSLTRTMKQSGTALQRFVKHWEARQETHVALVCMCTDARVSPSNRFREAPRWSTLTLATPVDVQFASSIISVPERTLRQLRLVARRAQQRCDKSVLEALGLAHANADLLACQAFGDLWVAELLAMHEAKNSSQVQMLEQASRRAALRLRAAGNHLLRLVVGDNPTTEAIESVDVAPGGTEIALVATQAGRDAGRLLERVLFSQDYPLVRAAMVPLIRKCAHAAVRAASAFTRKVPTYLPHAPTASLFGDRHDGVAAFLRATSMTSDAALVSAITAAYPSARLLNARAEYSLEEVATLRARGPSKPLSSGPKPNLVAAMRFRLASLQMQPMQPMADDVENLTVDELAEAMAAVKLGGAHRSFYVPFGFGDARPPPTFPPCAAPMFGTVPVFCDALALAFEAVRDCVGGGGAIRSATNPLCVQLNPVLDCLPDPDASAEVETVHPNVLRVANVPMADGKACVRVTYTASRAPEGGSLSTPIAPPSVVKPAALAVADVNAAAKGTGETYLQLSACVSSIAWNAERVVQAVVAALASADSDASFDAIEIALELPPDGTQRSHWYSKPIASFQTTQTQRRREELALANIALLDLYVKNQLVTLRDAIYELEQKNAMSNAVGQLDAALKAVQANEADKDWVTRAKAHDAVLDALNDAGAPWRSDLDDAKQNVLAKHVATIASTQAALVALLEIVAGTDQRIGGAQKLLQVVPRGVPVLEAEGTGDETSRRALVGALGLGMAMLAPLLQGVRVSCAPVAFPKGDGECQTAMSRVVDAFRQCEAVRLSEACLLVSQHVRVR